jgi:colicin import membrane protein
VTGGRGEAGLEALALLRWVEEEAARQVLRGAAADEAAALAAEEAAAERCRAAADALARLDARRREGSATAVGWLLLGWRADLLRARAAARAREHAEAGRIRAGCAAALLCSGRELAQADRARQRVEERRRELRAARQRLRAEREAAEQPARRPGGAPSEHGPDAAHQLGIVERLADEAVGAGLGRLAR